MTHHPDSETVRSILQLAVRAPSVHNTQPWLWRIGDRTVQLYADPARRLAHTDLDGRDLLISCGAALHHLCVGAAALGWRTRVHRLPNPADPNHLAAVEFQPESATPEAIRLADAIARRRSDRRRYTSWEVPAGRIEALVHAGQAHGVLVHSVESGYERERLHRAFDHAAREHAQDFEYGVELHQWSGVHATAQGVPARSAVMSTDPIIRPFAGPALPQAVIEDIHGEEPILVLATSGDERISRLRAGEAASAILLTATAAGLASCPLTEPLELAGPRADIRADVLHDSGFPQIIIRIGWAGQSADPISETPRRPLDEVVRPL